MSSRKVIIDQRLQKIAVLHGQRERLNSLRGEYLEDGRLEQWISAFFSAGVPRLASSTNAGELEATEFRLAGVSELGVGTLDPQSGTDGQDATNVSPTVEFQALQSDTSDSAAFDVDDLGAIDQEEVVLLPASTDADRRYEILGEIARGGMGVVYRGRDKVLGRDLAIKIIRDEHVEKRRLRRRFIEEAQIASQLQHPGIAPIYEVGQFKSGQPYFCMKLVEGETLATLLATRSDLIQDRSRFLSVFEQVCQTVAYAHSRGVIHRDLKPENVMVGAFGEVQVMDWGIAKVLPETEPTRSSHAAEVAQATESTADRSSSTGTEAVSLSEKDVPTRVHETQMGSILGTPAYMSPEQALGKVDQLDEKTDVFGLGAILCEILTGQPPYEGEDSLTVFRKACQASLQDAYSRLDDCQADKELVGLAKRCLADQRSQRPSDGQALAGQLKDYLEAVEARLRDSQMQHASEAARMAEQQKRFRWTLRLAGALVAAMAVGIAGTAWQAFQAEQSRMAEASAKAVAQTRLAQAEKANEILGSIFSDLDPEQIVKDGYSLQDIFAQKLQDAAEQLEGNAIGDPLVVADMQMRLGKSLYGLGFYDRATKLFEQAAEQRWEDLGNQHPETLQAIHSLAMGLFSLGRKEEALQMQIDLVKASHETLGRTHRDSLLARANLALYYHALGRRDKALQIREELVPLFRGVMGSDDPATLRAMGNLAHSYFEADQRQAAIDLQRQVVSVARQVATPRDPILIESVSALAYFYDGMGLYEDALGLREEVTALHEQVFGPEHPRTLQAMGALASSYSQVGLSEKASALGRNTLQRSRELLGSEHPQTLEAMSDLGGTLFRQAEFEEAIRLGEAVLQLSRKLWGEEHPDTLNALGDLAAYYEASQQHAKAIELGSKALELKRNVLGTSHRQTLGAMSNLAASFSSSGDTAAALEILEQALALERETLGTHDPFTRNTMWNLVQVYAELSRVEDAIGLAQEHLELSVELQGAENPATEAEVTEFMATLEEAGFAEEAHAFQSLFERMKGKSSKD